MSEHRGGKSHQSSTDNNAAEPTTTAGGGAPHENICTIPNLLTTARIVVTPGIGYLILHDEFSMALGLFAAAGISDVLDGYIARNFKGQASFLGAALDPFADKFMVSVVTIAMTVAHLIPTPLAALILIRDAALLVGSFYIRYISLKKHNIEKVTVAKYFDLSHPTVKVTPTNISKANTGVQLIMLLASLAAPVFAFSDHSALALLHWVTAASTVASGISYVNSTTAIQYLPPPPTKPGDKKPA